MLHTVPTTRLEIAPLCQPRRRLEAGRACTWTKIASLSPRQYPGSLAAFRPILRPDSDDGPAVNLL